MKNSDILRRLPGAILPWYEANRRELPWRQTKEPYRIWLSEIMLQQTRVEAVKGYYARFLEALPTVEALSDCDDDRLHKLWEGLGYYSRVRNLKKAARVIVEEYGGSFPKEYEKVLALPGIGAYTAGAICSICFDMPTPAVDGNVLRLVSRLTDDPAPIDLPATKAAVTAALVAIYPAEAGTFTQALMELGATLCGPNRAPECESCPCREFCMGYRNGTARNLPVKAPKKEKRQEDRTVFILNCDGRYALEKRPGRGLLAGLWQFPNVAGMLDMADALAEAERMGLHPKEIRREVHRKHIFTHIQWNMKGIYLEVLEPGGGFCWFTAEEINTQAALPTAFRRFWEEESDV
ncbi:MAG: A/G-specific adenine glycosylase [Oscillospiraceae bacterium]|nr:A/G-specific adenine glycosylase [Oscillospiraceae bacterium]